MFTTLRKSSKRVTNEVFSVQRTKDVNASECNACTWMCFSVLSIGLADVKNQCQAIRKLPSMQVGQHGSSLLVHANLRLLSFQLEHAKKKSSEFLYNACKVLPAEKRICNKMTGHKSKEEEDL